MNVTRSQSCTLMVSQKRCNIHFYRPLIGSDMACQCQIAPFRIALLSGVASGFNWTVPLSPGTPVPTSNDTSEKNESALMPLKLFGRPLQVTSPYAIGPLSSLVCNGVLWPNGWTDQDATWYGGRPWPRSHCVRLGPSSPTEKGTAVAHFSAHCFACTVAHLSNCSALVRY